VSAAQALRGLARLAGAPSAFWPAYVGAVAAAFAARRVLLLTVHGDRPWEVQVQWPPAADGGADARRVLRLAGDALDASPWLDRGGPGEGTALAMSLACGPVAAAEASVLVVLLAGDAPAEPAPLLALADLVADLPAQHLAPRPAGESAAADPGPAAGSRAEQLYDILQLSIRLRGEDRYMRAALALCNDLATRYRCDRVALGRVEGDHVWLGAISHVEKFDDRASATRELESAMEEALQQGGPVAWPDAPDSRLISRAHAIYARTQGAGHLLSVPVMLDERTVAVLMLERRDAPLASDETWTLGLIAQACARHLAELQARDRWIGARLWSRLQAAWQQLRTPRHTGWKLSGAALALALLVVALTPWTYRVETPMTLRSKDVVFLPAPFDGYLRRVHVEVGDAVRAGAVLLELDDRELALEESMAAADVLRYSRDAEKAQAQHQLADMQITLARQQQAASKLDLVRHQLANAQVRAPGDGVVIEGELKKNLGAPLRKGDLLLKIARTGDTHVEIEIDQADVHEVRAGTRGEFAFVGRPDLKYALVVDRVDPAAALRDRRNVFLAHARILSPTQGWWRPGMAGTARLDAGDRSLLWIMTHRSVRFLRQAFWL